MRLRHVSTLAIALMAGPAFAQAPVVPQAAPPAATGTAQPGTAQPGGAAPAGTAHPEHIPGAEAMAAHRAAYRLTLDRTRENSDIMGVQGAMLFEVLDACEGWTTRQRLTLQIINRDGQQVDTASDYSTYESKDGHTLRFSMTQSSGGAVSQRIEGEATRTADGSGTIHYEQPEKKDVAMPAGTLFPMMHTIHAIDAARAGQKLMLAPLMDGTDEDGAQTSSTFLLGWTAQGPSAPRFPLLSNLPSGRMRISFFGKDGNGSGAATPDYEVGLRYYSNGVADDMKMDFGEFTVNGVLEKLDALPSHC